MLGACGGVCAAAGFHNLAGREGSGDSRKKAERAGPGRRGERRGRVWVVSFRDLAVN